MSLVQVRIKIAIGALQFPKLEQQWIHRGFTTPHAAVAESRVLRAVDKVLESAQPSVEFTRRKYTDAHDAVVASATYSKAMEAAEAIVSNFKHSFVYRTAAARLYPVVSQFTDPALDRIVQSQYYSAVVDHLRPTSPPNCLQTAQ